MQSSTVTELRSASTKGPVMQRSTATDMLHVLKTEYGLDVPAARAFVASSLDASPKPRRGFRTWVHTVMTFSF